MGGYSLSPWRSRGIELDDIIRALRGRGSQGGESSWPEVSAQGPLVLFRLIGQELVVLRLRETDESLQSESIWSKAVECLAGELLSVLAIASVPDFDIVVNFGEHPAVPRMAHAHNNMQRNRHKGYASVPLLSLCTSGDFLDLPLPLGCAQVRCQTQSLRRTRSNSSKFVEDVNLWDLLTKWRPSKGLAAEQRQAASSGVFAARCFLFRMLVSYGELLRYAPGNIQTSFFSGSNRPFLRTFRSPRLQRKVPSTGDFESACAEAIDDAAQ